jgi:hypothetical protein
VQEDTETLLSMMSSDSSKVEQTRCRVLRHLSGSEKAVITPVLSQVVKILVCDPFSLSTIDLRIEESKGNVNIFKSHVSEVKSDRIHSFPPLQNSTLSPNHETALQPYPSPKFFSGQERFVGQRPGDNRHRIVGSQRFDSDFERQSLIR